MLSRAAALRFCCLFLAAVGCKAGDLRFRLLPPSSWVLVSGYDDRAVIAAVDPAFDSRWLLRNRQVNVRSDETFVHDVRQALTPAGARAASKITIDYEPACQALAFHWIRIWRNGAMLNRFESARFESAPATRPSGFVFSAFSSAVVTLPDVEPGDIVDYAYSLEGGNPSLGGKLATRVDLQSDEPIYHLVTRVLWPPPRKLYIQNHNTAAEPTTSYRSNLVEFTWDLRHVAGFRLEPQTPSWYDPYPWVELSEFQAWANVDRWAMDLFAATNRPSPQFDACVAECRRAASPGGRLLTALRFVQERIQDSPRDLQSPVPLIGPSAVLERLRGDSADKAQLLVALLRAMHIDAAPVLVNTALRQAIADWHPTAAAFNRAMVEATVAGATYWLDPTAQFEQGALAFHSWPNCACGLVVKTGTTALAAIPPPPLPKTTFNEYFTLGGMTENAELKVNTIADGADADVLRRQLVTVGRVDLDRDHRAAFEPAYPDIETTAPLAFAGGGEFNRVDTTEFYRIPNMWIHLPDEAFFHCQLYAAGLKPYLQLPSLAVRSQPLAIPYPVHQAVHIETLLPTTVIAIAPETQTIDTPGFVFRRSVQTMGPKLIIDFDYRTTAEALEPGEVENYAVQLESASKLLGYTVMAY